MKPRRASSARCHYPAHIFENKQEEGVSLSLRSGWRPGLMGSRRRAPSQGVGASWCRLVWALCRHTLRRQAACLLTAVCPPRKGWILVKAARCSSHSTCINLHMQPCNPRPEGGHSTLLSCGSPPFPFSLSPAWLNPSHCQLLPTALLCAKAQSHHCHISPASQQLCKAFSLVYKDPVTGKLLSHSSLFFISPRESCLFFFLPKNT